VQHDAAIAESANTSSVDPGTLLELARRTDPGGVLLIFPDAQPAHDPPRGRLMYPTWTRSPIRARRSERTRAASGWLGEPTTPTLADSGTSALGDPAPIRVRGRIPPSPSAADHLYRTGAHEGARKPDSDRTQRGSRSSERHKLRRLGSLEYALLTLIICSVAVTIAMAILDPSG
jgi:hypothetical protein